MSRQKLIRITTVPASLKILLKGQHKFMNDYFEVIGISSSGEHLDDVKTDEEIRVVPLEMTRTISPLKDLKSVWKLYRILTKEKPQIVHTHTPKAGTIGMIASWLSRVPIRIHTVAGLPLLEATGSKRKLLNLVERITYRCSTHLYPNSKGLYNIILANKFDKKEKLKVIANGSSNGIDVSHFNFELYSSSGKDKLKSALGIDVNDFTFIFVGRLVGDKGINELIEAFSEVQKNHKNIKLLLVGPEERDLDPLFPETIQGIKDNNGIISVGFQKDVRPYFSISNALVFPTYREGFPNVVMQAGAMGLPAIVTNINGCNEIIIEGKNGTIIPTKNKVALQSAMTSFFLNANKLKLEAPLYREMIVDRYEQAIVWNSLLAEYRRLQNNV